MAYDLALDVKEWDLLTVNNDLLLIDNAERIAQQICITLKFWLGEWFLNKNDGVPYLERIMVKNPNLRHIRQILREKIMSVDGVESVSALNLFVDNENRILSVTYEAATSYGLVTGKEVLGYE